MYVLLLKKRCSNLALRTEKRTPYQLSNMVVLETAAGKRILIRSDAVKMIEEIE